MTLINFVFNLIGIVTLAIGIFGFWLWLNKIEKSIDEINRKLKEKKNDTTIS